MYYPGVRLSMENSYYVSVRGFAVVCKVLRLPALLSCHSLGSVFPLHSNHSYIWQLQLKSIPTHYLLGCAVQSKPNMYIKGPDSPAHSPVAVWKSCCATGHWLHFTPSTPALQIHSPALLHWRLVLPRGLQPQSVEQQ